MIVDSEQSKFVRRVATDLEAMHLLRHATSTIDKEAFITKLEHLTADSKTLPRGTDPFRTFLTWCHNTDSLPTTVKTALAARKLTEMQKRATKRTFIDHTNLDWKHVDRDAFLDAIPVTIVKTLKTPFPPVGHHIAISPSIVKKWHHHFAFGKQADTRKPRRPIHLLNPSKLTVDLAPTDSAIFKNKKGDIIGVVLRNFCPDEDAVAWADTIAERALPLRKNIRMEDTGKLVQIGYSAGSRSSPKFDWVKNLLSETHPDDVVAEIDKNDSSVFAFAWQQLRALLPSPIIDNFDLYLNDTKIRRMDAHGQLPSTQSQGSYSVKIRNNDFTFHNAELAPPTGVFGQNYSRPIHFETQPHKYAASWTLSRNVGLAGGMHFYFAKYGIRVQGAPNTVIVWIPREAHGTCLPNYHPTNDEPPFSQRGLAFVTSNRLPSIWQAYLEGHLTHAQALQEMARRSDERYG
ncbi:hypothetical protein Hypma_012446 [Hypsizygus marmoreus]|uniref:Uncharacterized protein n=1 Tax=Hypsizygus marmoreus TaxID=39966 RepID=A0A369JEZ7_HYPMA|nr:hypothetical protein Hypma_012446 [Hypsizygus marmoreus]